MREVTVTDENGVDFHAITWAPEGADRAECWVFTDKKSGFEDNVGTVNMKDLKHLGNGKYGAGA